MRLKSIKLVGFKSFVDPTTVSFPTNLCAIVGPNGCGKSNIIDAVRWVMGESSARQLRGEASTDVIFNGSSTRKPTALATIELLFDNGDRRIGGEYAAYAEIAVRRQITRDGQSQYMLNGVRCRRRDVLDVFLGTGFGARSYSIIEQGMISEIVEAKPEELRLYLEEAAGVSKYRERRRETENRIRHTRDNLARLADLRGELATQIARLERQAEAAERYRALKSIETRLGAEVLALRWRDLGLEEDRQSSIVRGHEVDFEREVAEQRRLEAAIEAARAAHEAANERFNEVQGRFYSIGADLARVEESIVSRTRRGAELATEIESLAVRQAALTDETTAAARHFASCDAGRRDMQPSADAARDSAAAQLATLAQTTSGHSEALAAFERVSAAAAEHQRRADACASRIEHVEMLIERLEARRLTLDDERRVVEGVDDGEVRTLEEQVEAKTRDLDGVAASLSALAIRIGAAQGEVAAAEESLEEARRAWQQRERETSAIAAVQDAALGRRDNRALGWLEAAGLANARRLAETLGVTPGWERAVEAVLGGALSGVLVDRIGDLAARIASLDRGRLVLVETGDPVLTAPTALARHVSGAAGRHLFAGVHAVESLADALALRTMLAPGESVVTRAGVWLGPDWLRVSDGDEQEHGVLLRAQELATRQADLARAAGELDAARERLAHARRAASALEVEREAVRQRLADGNRELGVMRADASVGRVRFDETRARFARIDREHRDLVGQIEHERDQRTRLQGERLTLALEGERLAGERVECTTRRDAASVYLDEARREEAAARDRAHARALELQAAQAAADAADAGLQRLRQLDQEIAARRSLAVTQRADVVAPLASLAETRAAALAARAGVERELGDARMALDSGAQAIRLDEALLSGVGGRASEIRERLDAARLANEGLRARRGAVAEQLRAIGEEVELVSARLSPSATLTECEAELARTQARVERLGAINLAAIEEYEAQSARKQYLDAQNDDLETALSTLEGAMQRIDRETRTRFRETFDAVNSRLGELFPQVFGGGEASLAMDGDDWLNAGVSFMARPPGKRNASIHLLSGGEKALSALALILSIFQLNPSPVCLLDEVDAPLDDSNVARYAALIRGMSQDVQFVYVTHNKISMEIADQLMGVTMQEPGVSRLVSVDVERAVAMAGG